MKFIIIDPKERLYQRVDAKDPHVAYDMVGLKPLEVDHGVLLRLQDGGGIGYVVYEFSFFVPATEQHFFSLNGALIAGPTVLYQYDEHGRTIDIGDTVITTKFFDDAAQVEHLIAAGVLVRPEIKVNGELLWSWPQPAPPDLADKVAARNRR